MVRIKRSSIIRNQNKADCGTDTIKKGFPEAGWAAPVLTENVQPAEV